MISTFTLHTLTTVVHLKIKQLFSFPLTAFSHIPTHTQHSHWQGSRCINYCMCTYMYVCKRTMKLAHVPRFYNGWDLKNRISWCTASENWRKEWMCLYLCVHTSLVVNPHSFMHLAPGVGELVTWFPLLGELLTVSRANFSNLTVPAWWLTVERIQCFTTVSLSWYHVYSLQVSIFIRDFCLSSVTIEGVVQQKQLK